MKSFGGAHEISEIMAKPFMDYIRCEMTFDIKSCFYYTEYAVMELLLPFTCLLVRSARDSRKAVPFYS